MKKSTSSKTLSKKQIENRLNEAMKQEGISLETFKTQMKSWRQHPNL